ncbi:MAG: T9SS type A sorting domain-containing protein, partial [Bacteroidales bacterium]|nr:T9SS type A sorting domain-containing protein [Bacteroidales bacterium]
EAGTELVEDETLVAWAQDVDENGTWDVLGEPGLYYVGASSMPQIVIDDNGYIFLVYSSVTETYDNGLQDYRHIWARGSWGTGSWGDFVDLTGGLVHIFDECVFPSVSPTSDDNIYLMFQTDNEPGLAVRGDEDPYGDNNINFMSVMKTELIAVGTDEHKAPVTEESVSQNMPNPFNGTSWVNIDLHKSCEVFLEVSNIAGQTVYATEKRLMQSGSHRLRIDADLLRPGIYFYTVHAGESSITKKMIVE